MTFTNDAITRRTILPDRFMARCRATLLTEDLIDEELANELSNIGWLFLNTELKKARGQDSDIAFVMLCAAQRQVCSGAEEARVWDILGITFKHIA